MFGSSEIAFDRFGISAFYPIVCDNGLEAIHRVHPAAEEVETRRFVLETEQKVAARCNTRRSDVGSGTGGVGRCCQTDARSQQGDERCGDDPGHGHYICGTHIICSCETIIA